MCPLLPAHWKTTVLARTGRGAIHSSPISQIVSQEMVSEMSSVGIFLPLVCQVSSAERVGMADVLSM